jgi:hypothetical protein
MDRHVYVNVNADEGPFYLSVKACGSWSPTAVRLNPQVCLPVSLQSAECGSLDFCLRPHTDSCSQCGTLGLLAPGCGAILSSTPLTDAPQCGTLRLTGTLHVISAGALISLHLPCHMVHQAPATSAAPARFLPPRPYSPLLSRVVPTPVTQRKGCLYLPAHRQWCRLIEPPFDFTGVDDSGYSRWMLACTGRL